MKTGDLVKVKTFAPRMNGETPPLSGDGQAVPDSKGSMFLGVGDTLKP
jgi:hypothetical protein